MHSKLYLRLYRLLTVIFASMVLVGCLGEGSGQQRILATPPTPLTGVLVNAPLSGADYLTSGDLSGTTNDLGEFQYFSGDLVTFSIGGIILGAVPGAPVITPVELTNSLDPTSPAATNMLVFLQSIDADGDHSNGITISAATRTAAAGLTLDFAAANFSTQVATVVAAIAPGNAVVSESDALLNFYQTYVEFGGTDTFSWLFPGFPPVGGGVSYELVFADEFNEGTAPSPATWNIETGYGDNGWGNNEWQLYTDSADNLRVEDGNLVITALCPTPPCGVRDGTVTSARINTQDKFEFSYGKIVARIKPPVGDGAWPAFWALGANFPEIGWPRSGEIDFMEMHNAFSDNRTTHSTMHWCDETIAPPLPAVCFPAENGWVFFTQNRTFPQSLGDGFHIWEADWTPDGITVSMDGVQYFSRAIDPATMEEFRRDFFLIFNVAMGGTLGSADQPPNGSEVFPQTMLVDYVRVYQQVVGETGDVLVDFEDAPESYDFGMDAGFGGGASVVIANPDQNALNPTAQVARMQKFPAEDFGGSTLSLGSNLNFSQGSVFKMKVWASRPVEVLFKLEDAITGEPADGKESFVDHSGSSMWEELCFEFDGLGGFTSNSITFIFDLGVLGDAENNPDDWTFYFDEIQQVESCEGGEPPPPPLISSFSNGSFETGDLSDWTGTGDNTVGAPGVGAYVGTLAAQLTTTGGTGVAEISQTFAANPGDEVNLSAWVLTESALPSGDTFGLAKIVFQDAGGNDLVPASASIGTLNTINPGIDSAPLLNDASAVNTWIFTEAQGVAPAGTTQVKLLLLNVDFAGGENPMWFDFVELSLVTDEPPPPPPEGLALSNGGFESGDLTDWTGGGTVGAPGVGARTGAFAAQLTTSGGNGVGEIRQTFDAAPGDEVNFSAWMLTENALPTGATFGLAKIVFQDAGGNDLVPASASIGVLNTDNPGIDSAPTLTDTSTPNTWVFTEAQGVAPAGTTQVAFLLLNVDFAGGENPMWFDDAAASLVEGEPPPPPPEGLALSNGGFESGDLTDWTGGGTVGAPGVGARTGAFAAQLTTSGGNGVGEIRQTFDAAPGDEVNFSAWMLTENALPTGATFGLAKIVFQDAGGNDLVPESASIGVLNTDNPGIDSAPTLNDTSTPNTWVFTEAQGVAPAGTTQVAFLLLNVDFAGGENPMWFDDTEASLVTDGGGVTACAPCTIDFESSGVGGDFGWSVFENADNPPLEIVANPDMTGNTSATVAKFTARVDGEFFAGAQTFHPGAGNDPGVADIGPFTFDSTNSVVKVWVWKPVISEVRMQFVNTTDGAQEPLSVSNTKINEWEQLTFDFTSFIGTTGFVDTDRLVIFPDWNTAGRTSENIIYFDEITFGAFEEPPPPPPPMELAISNGGFETGDLTDWTGGGTVGAPGVGANTGDFAVELPGGGVGEIRQTYDAAEGDEINFSVYMLTEGALPTGATFGLAKIVFQDAAGNDLDPASASIGTLITGDNPGVESTPFLNDASTPNTWVFSEAQGVAPAGTAQVALLLLNIDFAGGVNNMWFDDAAASLVGDEPPPPPPMELAISNGGFETGDLTDWTGGGTVGAPGVGANTGDFAVELPGGGVGEIRQTYDAAEGDEINFSVYMLTEGALPTGATFGLAKIVFQDAAGNDLDPASASIGTLITGDNPGVESTPFLNDASTPNTWVFSEAQGVAPAGTAQVALLLLNIDFAGGVNNMWFDDAAASLVGDEPPPPPPMELAISNGGFETGDLTDWTGGGTVGAPGVGANTGDFAVELPGGGVGEIRQTYDAAEGDEINFSVYMLTEGALPTGATFGLAKIVFQDAAGNDLDPASASIGTLITGDNPGVESTPFLNDASTPNTWVFSEAQGVAPAGTAQVALLLLNIDFAGGVNNMWFDDAAASLVGDEPPPPPPMELAISNGGFETGDLTDWTGGGTVGAPGVGANTGDFAVELPGGGVGEIRQTYDAAEGDEINFSVYMLTEGALPTGATFGLAKIVFQDAAGNDLDPASASIGTLITGDNPGVESTPFLNDASTPNTWVFSEAQGVAPAGTAQVALLLLNIDFAGGVNNMWFDDAAASLVGDEPPPPPPMELAISNGGFETGDLTDWTGGGTVGAPGVGANTGDFAVELPGGGVGEIRQTYDAAEGDEINFSVYMLTEGALPTGATFGLAKIVFQDAAGNDLDPASASIGTLITGDNPGVESTPFLNDASTPNTWVFSEAQGVAPAGTAQVALLLLNIDFAGGVNNMWFDDAAASLVGDEPPPPPPMELAISNGGFETGDLTDWTGGGTVGAPGVGANTGDFAVELPGGGVGEIRQTFDAIPGDEVNLSVWMLTEGALPTGATFGLAKIVFQDAAGNDLDPASASIGTLITGDNPGVESTPFLNDASPINTWIFSEAQGVAPAGTAKVVFLLLNIDFAGGVNNMWFDDAAASLVTAGEPPPPPPMALAISNGGFETGDLTDWTGGGTVGAPGFGARTGAFAAQLTTSGGNGVGEIRQTFDAAPGDEINFSAWMLTENALPTGATFGLAKIIFQDAGGNDLVPESASIGVLNTDNPGIDSAPTLNDTSTPNTWVFTEAQGVAPAGTTQVAFLLLNVDFAGGENPMWFDDAAASLVDACGGGEGGELTTNGDFEGSPGTLDCWDIFPGGGTITAESTENNTVGGAWSAHAVAGPGNNPVLKQSFLAAGTVNPGDTILISFDMKGSAVAGGIVFPELIDERSDMGATGQLLDTIVAPTPGWTSYFYSPMAGPDVAGGITFQIAVVCGGDPACSNDVYIDNVSVMISGGGG